MHTLHSSTYTNSNWQGVNNVEAAINSLYASKTSDNYSTEEIKVGTWIDGKPLYQKVVSVKSPTSSNTWAEVYSVEDAEYIRVVYGEIEIANSNVDKVILNHSTSANISTAGNKIKIYTQYTNRNTLLVIQYTKTTD